MKQRVALTVVCAAVAAATAARAQDDPVEITPYAFLGSNASGGVGGAVRWPLPGPLSVELESSIRRAQVAPFSANATGIGLDQYVSARQAPSGQVVAQSGTAIAVNAGGGARFRAGEKWGVRTDARWVNGIGQQARAQHGQMHQYREQQGKGKDPQRCLHADAGITAPGPSGCRAAVAGPKRLGTTQSRRRRQQVRQVFRALNFGSAHAV